MDMSRGSTPTRCESPLPTTQPQPHLQPQMLPYPNPDSDSTGSMVCKEWKDGELVRLNVGGKEFSTTVDTLTKLGKSEYLTALFAGKFGVRLDSDGRVFLDRDGERFRLVLNYLRCGTVHIKEDDLQSMHEVLEEAEFFGVNDLVDLLRAMIKEAEARREKRREEEDKQVYAKIMAAHFPMSNVAVPVNLAAATTDPKYHQQIQQLHLLQQQYQLQQQVVGAPSPFALSGGHPTPNMLSQQSYSDATSTIYMNGNQNPPGFPRGELTRLQMIIGIPGLEAEPKRRMISNWMRTFESER